MTFEYEIFYHPDVPKKDLPRISPDIQRRIRQSIELKLGTSPQLFSAPLRRSLHGYWKLRIGDYRVIYKMDAKNKQLTILRIGHRREVYD